MNNSIIIQYRKSLVKTGSPIVVKVGRTEITTNKITLDNVSAEISFNAIHKDKHGTTTPMIIPIDDAIDIEPYTEEDEITIPVITREMQLEIKATKQRDRYRKKNPIVKRTRK